MAGTVPYPRGRVNPYTLLKVRICDRIYAMNFISRTRIIVVASATVLIGTAVGLRAEAPAEDGRSLVSQDSIMVAVKWLADDAREGRMTGTPGCAASATWIADRFKSYGLSPGVDDESYFQTVSVPVGIEYGDDNSLSFTGVRGLDDLKVDKDFTPFAFTKNGTADLPLVFVGYGITAEDLNYDDYAGIDVEGKAVLMLRHEPQLDDEDSIFNGDELTEHATFRNKAKNAAEHGAAAMILFTGPGSRDYKKDRLVKPQPMQSASSEKLFAAHIKHRAGEALLESAGTNVKKWIASVDKDLAPHSFAFDEEVQVHVSLSIEQEVRPSDNVVGILPGTDPHSGALIIGAHYDHLGRGNSSSLAQDKIGEIHNGADDNASGTSVVVELARVFGQTGPLKRTLIFAAFTGEELGLHGSSYLAEHPPIPLEYVQAMLNLDMVGRPSEKTLTIGGIQSSPQFEYVLNHADERSFLTTVKGATGTATASDHTSFDVKGVPNLFFFTGIHNDYHRPSDDWQTIDPEGITEVARFVYDVALDLATSEERVEYAASSSAGAPAHGEGSGTGGYGPAWLGTVPDFGKQEYGVRLSGVRPGGPAEKAGIQAGDVIIRFAGREIGDLYEYTDAIRASDPGDVVDIVVLRDGKEITLTATMGTRE